MVCSLQINSINSILCSKNSMIKDNGTYNTYFKIYKYLEPQ
jgi:hypothetical protein